MTLPDNTAFPMPDGEYSTSEYGLTKREYFAGLAMQGMAVDNPKILQADYLAYWAGIARTSVVAADALIAALNEVKE